MKLNMRFSGIRRAGRRAVTTAGLLGALALFVAPAHAAFEVGVSPSRVTASAKAGERIGRTLQIDNVGAQATRVRVSTLDWSYSESGELSFQEPLQAGSCRPWVVLERPELELPARGTRNFRFQVEVPKDAPRGECRFMIAVEGTEPAGTTTIERGGAQLSLPVNGRIAVAVYVRVNGAAPQLTLQQVGVVTQHGARLPAVTVHNAGDAHGRLEGGLDATDASGKALTLMVEGSPILAGQTRTLTLQPRDLDNKPIAQLNYPLKVSGTLDWEEGGFKVDAELK